MIVTDIEGKVRLISRAYSEMAGIQFELPMDIEGILRSSHAVIEGSDMPFPLERTTLLQALRGHASKSGGIELVRPDGRRIAIESSGVPLMGDEGGIIGAITVIADISLRKQVETNQASNYQLMFESNPQPMWVYDENSLEFLEVNDAAIAAYGYTREEFLSMKIEDIRPPEDREGLREQMASMPALFRGMSVRHVHKDGAICEVEVTSHTIPFAGRSARVVAVDDVTEQKALQRDLFQRQQLESLGQLAAGVAHDFNNLLSVIINNANFVVDEVGDNPGARKDLEQIKAAAERAIALTRQLLIFGRRQPIKFEVLELNGLVGDVSKLLGRTLGEHIEVVVKTGGSLAAIKADRAQVEQVLINLAVNARDAMPEGGVLTIETSILEINASRAAAMKVEPGQFVCLSITDAGCGMSPETLAHAFEPFFTTKGPGRGTGLGLATVYGVVTAAGGAVSIDSHLGVGTSIRSYFPAIDSDEIQVGQAEDPALLPGQGEVILVVDDEAGVREVAARILRSHGYVVLEASTSEEAMEVENFDLVLTDAVMPNVSGYELVKRIRERSAGKPAILMSGYGSWPDNAKVLESKLPMVAKPFDAETLLRMVGKELSSSR